MDFWKVQEKEDCEVIELPSENDGTLLLTTLSAQFPGASGLKYRAEDSGAYRGIRLADGKLHSPEPGCDHTFLVVFPKGDNKRKLDEEVGGGDAKKRDSRFKCSDLIILGLPYKTDEDTVRDYFKSYGELLLVQVKKNPQTGRSKGFGFVRFANIESQAKVICCRHFIDGRWCEVKIAGAKNQDPTMSTTKIFVGRLTEDITTNDLNEYFSKFGNVLDVYIPKPFRGFAFVNFADPYVAYTLCLEPDDHIIKKVSVHVSKASPRGESKPMDQGNYGYGGKSSYGGGNYGGNMGGNFSSQQYRSSQGDYRNNNDGYGRGNQGRDNQNRSMGGGGGPPPASNSNDLTNLSALTPALIAAALNQAGLGTLLSSLQQNGKTEPPPPPPLSRFSDSAPQSSNSNRNNWDSNQSSGNQSRSNWDSAQGGDNQSYRSNNWDNPPTSGQQQRGGWDAPPSSVGGQQQRSNWDSTSPWMKKDSSYQSGEY